MPERIHIPSDGHEPLRNKIRLKDAVAESRSCQHALNSTIHGARSYPEQAKVKTARAERPHVAGFVDNHHPTKVTIGLRERARALLTFRRDLPIWNHAQRIRDSLASKDVLLLVGETGSGKSTQVPQFLIDEPWCRPRFVNLGGDGTGKTVKVGGCIAITEPRRVAAITLARRVAEEVGTPLGSSSPASTVGYSVRFNNSTSPSTRIKYLTEGMLLQEMLRDPWLRQYSVVVIDEVHERGVNVDLVMGFMKNIVTGQREGRGGIPLKVVVMSATADMAGLEKFFDAVDESLDKSDEVNCNGNRIGQRQGLADDEGKSGSEWSGIPSDDDERKEVLKETSLNHRSPAEPASSRMTEVAKATPTDNHSITGHSPERKTLKDQAFTGSGYVSVCHIEGRQYPVQTIYSTKPVADFVDAALRTVFQIHYKEPLPGDILVFLTGQETVESLEELVKEYALNLGPELPKLLVLPLFAALPQAAQQRVFQPTPNRTRKVILATNIAETSVTVAGVRFVVDCGKSKIKQFRTRLGLDSLLVKPISQSAATQRKGRAGREAPGKCYRLYTEADFCALAEANTPEILRCDLSQAILTMKARGVIDIVSFPFLDRPPREALEKALMQLFQLRALTESGYISELGLQIAKLPLAAPLGRVLLAAADPAMDCLAEAIDIISCLSVENVFLNLTSEESKERAEIARRALFRREGDHLTLLATVQAYAAEAADRKAWAERHFVSHRAMQAVMVTTFRTPSHPSSNISQDVRKQLLLQCQHLNLPVTSIPSTTSAATSDHAASILKCFLRGFATNTARLSPDGSYRTLVGNQTVAIHPSSGLFGKKVEAIMYNEFVFTNRSYARGVSAVQMDWVGEVLGV